MYSCTSLQCRSSRWHEQSVRALPGYYTSINGTVRCSATMSDDVLVGRQQIKLPHVRSNHVVRQLTAISSSESNPSAADC